MTSTKQRSKGIYILLLLMFSAMLRFLLADECSIASWGCAIAAVTIGEASWGQGGCPPGMATSPDPKDIPLINTKCGFVEGDAGAVAATIIFSSDVDHPCIITSQFKAGGVEIEAGSTGCKIEQKSNACGGVHFKI